MIPNDWDVKTLGDFVSLQRGHDLTEVERRPGNVPVMGSAGQNGFHDKAIVTGPGVLVGRSGASFGQVHFCKDNYWPHNTALYVTDFHGNDPRFTFYFLKAIDFSRYNSGGAQPSLNRNFIYPIPVGVPKPDEQRWIASVLGDVDILISKLDKLIAKKRDLKQAAMQQLLTGKRRLPGFSEEWEVKRLKDIAQLKNGYAFKSSTYSETGTFKVITISNVQDGFWTTSDCALIDELPADIQPHQRLHLGDYLISMTGNVGRVCKVVERGCLLNQRVGKIVPCSANPDFLFHLIRQTSFLQAMMLKAKGGAQGNLSVSDILEYEFHFPLDQGEQRAIAAILSDMDSDIVALEAHRDKTLALEQGMMQQLLTGNIRLI